MNARRGGFSLVEALAALLVASMVLLAALSLQGQMAQAERRYERAMTLAELKRTAMVLVRDINPASEPTGARALGGDRRLVWTATPVGDFRTAGGGRFEVRLYRLTTTLIEPDGRPAAVMRFDRVGWRPAQRGVGATTRP